MTCIAYRAPYIVADQRIGSGGGRLDFGRTTKIYTGNIGTGDLITPMAGKFYASFAGNMGTEHVLVPYVKACLEMDQEAKDKHFDNCRKYIGDKKDQDSFEGIVVAKDFKSNTVKVYTLEPALFLCEFTAPFVGMGSGVEIAVGAMAHGAMAWEAVHHATVWDGGCGYPIDGYNVWTGEHWKFQDFEELKEFVNAHKF